MNVIKNYQPLNHHEMQAKLDQLSQFNSEDSMVISCYLDTQPGKGSCEAYITEKLHQALDHLPAQHLAQRDELINEFITVMHDGWQPQAKSLGIFCNNPMQQREFKVFALPQTEDDDFTLYTKANILPLQKLLNTLLNSSVLAFIDDVVQIYDINLGNIRPMAWAMAPHLSNQTYLSHSKNKTSGTDQHLQKVCLSLLKSHRKPIVIAASTADQETIKGWLPRKIAWNIHGTITLPYELGHSNFVDYLQDYHQQQTLLEAQHTGSSLINSLRSRGSAVIGPVSTLEALREQRVERLVISKHHTLNRSMQCLHCDSLIMQPQAMRCSNCGQATHIPWDPVIEASWLAQAQQLPVTQVDSDEFRYLGGMGCFLKHHRESDFMPIQTNRQVNNLDRVA